MRLTTSDIARVTGGALLGAPITVDRVEFDSRNVTGGELFVPLRDARDGHDYLDAALVRGAAAYLTERPGDAGPGVRVADCRVALRALAVHARSRLEGRHVVAITGSVGKTTTKDLTAAAVRGSLVVHANAASFNNDIGVPHTLLGSPDDVDVVVAEIGANGLGEIAAHAAVVQPTVGIVTRVAAAHTEGFGGIEAIATEKGALVESLPASGLAILNADDPRVLAMRERTEAQVVTYGAAGDVRVTLLSLSDILQPTIAVHTPWGDIPELTLAVRGEHQVGNAAAAIAAAASVGVDLDDIADRLRTAAGSRLRMSLERTPSGVLVLDDTYNANPASMEAGLRALAALPARRRVAVLGAMAELGEVSEAEHRQIAELGRRLDVQLLAVGTEAYGVPSLPDAESAVTELSWLADGDAVLVKGSRSARMDQLAALLRAPRDGDQAT